MKINIPGLHNSDENHWQTFLEKNSPNEYHRILQDNWSEPDCSTWINTIEEKLSAYQYDELVLIGHSIGCIAIVKWFETYQHQIKGALFVAPSDAERGDYPNYIKGFTPIPTLKLPFPTIVVASTNDPVTDLSRSKKFANDWGSRFLPLKNAEHIETNSGFGEWPLSLRLIHELDTKSITSS